MISTCSRLKVSRTWMLLSRTPSTKMLPAEFCPRMMGMSPPGRPPSPAPKVMPGELRSTSCSEVAAWSWITCWGTTCTVRGVSSRGAVIFGDWDTWASYGDDSPSTWTGASCCTEVWALACEARQKAGATIAAASDEASEFIEYESRAFTTASPNRNSNDSYFLIGLDSEWNA